MKKLLIACLLLAGCATGVMQSFIGQDVRQVAVKRGPPANVMDMGDGRRAFQWMIQESITTPVMSNTYGNANIYGNTATFTTSTVTTGGTTSGWTCVYTLYGRWDEARQGWIVESFEKPDWKCL